MKNLSVSLVFFLGLSMAVYAQRAGIFKYQNSVHFEAGGHCLVYSLNYERNIINTRFYKLSQQGGLALYPAALDLRSNIWIPYSINQLFSYHQHHLETGIGLVLT